MPTNQEIADDYNATLANYNPPVPKDYRDRAVELAIYFNQTLPDGTEKDGILSDLKTATFNAYDLRVANP